MYAAEAGKIDLVKYLVEEKAADPHAINNVRAKPMKDR